MADTNANIRIDVDASAALAQIKQLQRQISLFHSSMVKGGAAAAAEAQNLQRNLVNSINATGQFTANMTRIKTTTESFTNALEKNKLSMGQYFRFAGASTKTFGSLFKSEFATINKVARERVKDLQTQYIKMGRDANGAMQAIRVRPLTLDLQNLGTQTAIAAQKQALFNQLIRQGSVNLLNWGKNTQWAGRQLMVGFTIPLTIMGAAASREFMKLEEQAIRFKRVYGDMFTTEAETQKAIADIKELANEFTKYGIAVEKTVDLAASVAQMGAQGQDLINQVTQATRLAVLGGIEQQDALNTTISLTNAFGLATEELADKIAFLNAAENQTILSIEDFNEAIPKAGSVVQQLGGNVEDLAFFLTAMREGGINASQGANALKTSLARLVAPTEVAKKEMAAFGIDIVGIVENNAGNLKDTVMNLAVELDKLDPLNRARAIEQLFGKFQFARMSTMFQNIVKEGSQANKVLELSSYNARELGIIAERELGRVEASSMFKFQKALEEFQAALAPVGEAFLKLATPIIEFGTRLLDKFNDMGDGAKTFVVGFIAVLGVVAPALLMIVGLVANGIANLLLFSTKVSGAFSKTGGASNILTEQLNYMNSEQIESAAVAASLDQVHQTLIQTFNAEAGAVGNLAAAYGRAIQIQQQFLASQGAAGAAGAARGAAGATGGTSRYNPFMPPKYADGILSVPGPKGAGDIVAAMLSPGEAVIPADMAKKYAPFISSIIADNVPGFSSGYQKNIGGRVVEETHVAPVLEKTDAVMGAVSKIVPGFDQLGDKLQEVFIVLGDLTATKPRELNQEAKGLGRPPQDRTADRAMTGEEFLSEWNVTEGTGFDRTAERAGLLELKDRMPGTAQKGTYEEGVPEALSDLDKEVGSRVAARIDAMPETEKAVEGWLDRLMEEVTQEVISEFAQESGTAKAKVATALAGRAATPSGLRTVAAQNVINDATGEPYGSAPAFFEDMEAQGQLERREGRQGLFVPETDIKPARPNRSGGFRTNSLSASTLGTSVAGGTFEYPGGKGTELTPIEEAQDAYLGGQKVGEAHNDGVESVVKDPKDISSEKSGRNSPHPDAFPDGADDAKAYLDGQNSVLTSGSDPYQSRTGAPKLPPGLAPPPPPVTADIPKTRKQAVLDAVADSGPGKWLGKQLAKQSGVAVSDSKGQVFYDPNEDESTWAGKMERENRLAAEKERLLREETRLIKDQTDVAAQQVEAANKLDNSAAELTDAALAQERSAQKEMYDSDGNLIVAGGGKGKGQKKARSRGGGMGRGMGLSMGLSALTMGASMAPGALGQQAQKFMPALMGLSTLPMLLQALQSPLVAVLAAFAAIAGAAFMLNQKFKDTQKEAYELGKALGAGEDAMRGLAEFAGTVSAGEFMDKAREERLKGVTTAPGKTTFGESFVGDEAGQALVEALKTQIAETGDSKAAINSLTSQLATAVMTGVINKEQASSMAANIGFALNNMDLGLQVRANIAQLVGPNGEDITGGQLVEFSAKVNTQNLEAVRSQVDMMNKNLDGVFGDELSERIGGSIIGGVAGAATLGAAGAGIGLAVAGSKLGATIGTFITPGIGTAVGAGLGAIAGAVASYFIMRDTAEEAGKLSGAVVATMTNALEQQQELSDAVDAFYIKKLDEAKVQGDITEQLRLQTEYEQKKVELSEQEMAMRNQLRGALTGPGAEAARTGIQSAIETRFKDDPTAQLVLPGIQASMDRLELADTDRDVINFELATGSLDPAAVNSLLAFVGEDGAQVTALLDIVGQFGGVFATEASQIMSLIDDEEVAADIFVNISQAGNEQEAQEILDFVREIQRQDGVFDTDIILRYMQENENVAEELQDIFDRADMGVTTVEQAYDINPVLQDADAFNERYFNMLPDADKEQYVKTVSMVLAMDETELIGSDDFNRWLGDEGQALGPFPGSNSFAWWQKRYAEGMGQKVTKQLSAVDFTGEETEVEDTDGGGGPQASDLDDLLKRLRDIRKSQIEVTKGWAESRAKLDELFGEGRNIKIFGGIEQQLRGLDLGEDLISMITGMDPEEYERRKDELFQFDEAGNIVGVTTALGNMGRALRAIALGDFQSQQQKTLAGLNDQFVAMRKLTAAGMSTAAAYEAVQDAAFAAAVARETDNDVIRETIKLTKEATEVTRAYQAAQALATKNAESQDLKGAIKFIEQNAQSLSEAQKSAIMSDPDLQALIMNPSVDPKTLREALRNAEEQADLDLRIKKLTFEGLVEVFSDGFNKAMEAFSVKEKDIELDFEVKKDPFLEAIKEAEEDIADIRNRAGGLDDLEADLERISFQEEDINELYDKRQEALSKVKEINSVLAQQQKAQLDVAEALSRGDIAAAAQAVQQYRQQQAQAAAKKQEEQLEIAREKALSELVGNTGKTRLELEEQIKELNKLIFNIEEDRLEPAQRQVELLDREKNALIESLEVLGKTRQEWELVKNNVDLSVISSDKFQESMQQALDVVKDITEYWTNFDDKSVDLFVNIKQRGVDPRELEEAIAPPPGPDGGSGGGGSTETAVNDSGLVEGASGEGRESGAVLASISTGVGSPSYTQKQVEIAEEAVARAQQLRQDYEDFAASSLGKASPVSAQKMEDAAIEAEALAESLMAPIREKTAEYQQIVADNAMEIFNAGAPDLITATTVLFDQLETNAEGAIANNIPGYFRDLGVQIPTLLQGMPNFFANLDATAREAIQGKIAGHLQGLATRAPEFLKTIPNFLNSLPDQVQDTILNRIPADFNYMGRKITEEDLGQIAEWFQYLPASVQESIEGDISQHFVTLADNATENLDGTIGEWFHLLPPSVADLIEGEMQGSFENMAEAAGMSLEDYIGQWFAELPEDVRGPIETELAAAFGNLSGNAIASMDPLVKHLLGIPDQVRLSAEEATAQVLAASTTATGEIVGSADQMERRILDAMGRTEEGVAGAIPEGMEDGVDASQEPLDDLVEDVENLPIPTVFAQHGVDSGNNFRNRFNDQIRNYRPEITVKVNYDTSDAPGNIGGLMGRGSFMRNNGGLMPYGKGGMARYLAGGVVGGFGNYDNVPAILTPGEFVIRREAVEKYGRNFFSDLNSTIYNKRPDLTSPTFSTPSSMYSSKNLETKGGEVMYNNSYQINVNVKSEANPDQIAKTVMNNIKRIDSQRIRSNRL